MTDQELQRLVNLAAEALRERMYNNCRCKLCGWVGPEEKLIATGSVAELQCPVPRCTAQMRFGQIETSRMGFELPTSANEQLPEATPPAGGKDKG